MKDLISIIVPVYNSEKLLPKCLDSIINQSYINLEIILIDDGSSDDSLHICYEYAERDKRVKVFHQENKGPSAAMNKGLDMAQGDYYTFVDCDDYVDPKMYEYLYENLKKYHADISVCDYARVYENINDNRYKNFDIEDKISIYNDREVIDTLYSELHVMNVVVWNKLYSKEIFSNLRFEVGKWHEDEFIVHRILNEAKRVVYSNRVLYFYLQRDSSFMGKKFNLTRLDFLKALEDRMSFLMEYKYTETYKKTLEDYLVMVPLHYYLVNEFFPNEKAILHGLKSKYTSVIKNNKYYLPVKLKVKYNLFTISPLLYKLLNFFWDKLKITKIDISEKVNAT